MSESAMTTEEVVEIYYDAPGMQSIAMAGTFERWLAAHDRAVAEKAWDEGFVECADMWSQQEGGTGPEPDSNPYRKGGEDE